jgi:hypothetical protein
MLTHNGLTGQMLHRLLGLDVNLVLSDTSLQLLLYMHDIFAN